MYCKRRGPSGIVGQLYETKLISLLYFRASHDNAIEDFQLASNVDDVGQFDDICFKAKIKGHGKPLAVFIQAKHSSNEKRTLQVDLGSYFNSYFKIRGKFGNSKDSFFNGEFDETECLFVLYTNAKVDFTDDWVGGDVSVKLNDLMDTGGTVKQPYKWEEHIEYLSKIVVKDEIAALAHRITYFTNKHNDLMMTDELVYRYHVLLAQKVFNVSELQPEGYRFAKFRLDFFDNNDEYFTEFKEIFFNEIVQRRKINLTDVKHLLTEFLDEPNDATKLSKLIGTVVTYNYGLLEIKRKYNDSNFGPQLNQVQVSRSTVYEAVELAAREILEHHQYIVPAAFGNLDFTLRGNDEKVERRLNYLSSKLCDLVRRCEPNLIVTVDDSVDARYLQLNGGLAGAIGNVFVLDDKPNHFRITDDYDSLGRGAKRMYTKLMEEIHNLHEYRFYFKVKKFPKLSFDYGEYEMSSARDFLNKLLFYTNQSDAESLEHILKMEIEDNLRGQRNHYQFKSDAIFLKFHDNIQKWWQETGRSVYLTKHSDLFENILVDIIEDSLMSILNVTYMMKIKQYDYTFTDLAVSFLDLEHKTTIISADYSVLTIIKVMQSLKEKSFVVLDLEYIASLRMSERKTLLMELKKTRGKILILICDKINSRHEMKTLDDIADTIHNKHTIIITNEKSVKTFQVYFPEADTKYDKKFSLSDMSEESRNSILTNATAIFPGVEIKLDHFLKGWPPRSKNKAAVAGKKTGKGGSTSAQSQEDMLVVPGTSQDPSSGV